MLNVSAGDTITLIEQHGPFEVRMENGTIDFVISSLPIELDQVWIVFEYSESLAIDFDDPVPFTILTEENDNAQESVAI